MAVPWLPDAPPFTGVWQYSGNAGGSYTNYAGGNLPQLVGPTGTQRFRRFFTPPIGLGAGELEVHIVGDLHSGDTLLPAELWINNAFFSDLLPRTNSTVFVPSELLNLGVSNEIRVNVGGAGLGGITRLDLAEFEYALDPPDFVITPEVDEIACCARVVATGCLDNGDDWLMVYNGSDYELLNAQTFAPVVPTFGALTNQVIFNAAGLVGADGWIQIVGGTQPPNRVLPQPIFDVGNQYQPNNPATGTWIIEKIISSEATGPGDLTIPPGVFPSGGGIFSDDAAVVSVNGVTVPFVGSGTGNIGPQTVPVDWVKGANTVQILVNNTVFGGTAVTGRLEANTPTANIVDCPGPTDVTTVETLQLLNPWTTQIAVVGLGSLVSWEVRALTLPVTLNVNGVSFAMDLNEVISSASQDNRVLEDTITASISGVGRAHVTSVRRYE
jgi:hypothetical protein